MFRGAIVLAGGCKAVITKMQENKINGVDYVYYINCKIEGHKKAGVYHPNDVKELSLENLSKPLTLNNGK